MSAQPLLDARQIVGGYGRRPVLHGVDLALERGEMVALLGPNGAGKTTLMKVLVGLIKPRSGDVRGPSGRAVGWVPQGGATYARLTVRENLELFARLLRLPGAATDIALAAATAANLEPWYEMQGSQLSGGLRQRLNVAVGMLGDPELLVLDEPTTGVDLAHSTELFRVLRERADTGRAVLFSTHALGDAATADRVVVIVDGRAAFDGSLAQVALLAPPDVGSQDLIAAGLLQLWAT